MGRTNTNHQAAPTYTPPTVIIPTIRIPQPDGGLLLRPGKPIVLEEFITTKEAARILGMSRDWVQKQIDYGYFTTAYQPSGRRGGKWKIARSEVDARKDTASEASAER